MRNPQHWTISGVSRQAKGEQRAKTFTSLVLQGKLRAAVRWVTDQEKEGVCQPRDLCTKTGEPVLGVLQAKHPDAQNPPPESLDA